jgi:hypothetical protein
LAALAAFTGICLTVSLTKDPTPPFVPPPTATSDVDVFERIVSGVRSGGSFYDVTQRELRSHGYPTRSVFNWRTPFYAWVFGASPGPDWARGLLVALVAATAAVVCFDLLREIPFLPACLGGVLYVGSVAWCTGKQSYLFTEYDAGALITLSIAARRRGWVGLAVGSGLAALFLRELSLPYVAVALGLSVREGRRREALAWGLGLLAFVAFVLVHASVVHARLTADDLAMSEGWVRFGGVRFVLATAQANVFLMMLPLWCTALYLPVAVLGLVRALGGPGREVGLTGLVYLAAFCVVGAPFNFYWGFLDAPILALGFTRGLAALAALVTDAFPGAAGLPHPAGYAGVSS